MNRVIAIEPKDEYILVLEFNDGFRKEINFKNYIGNGVSEKLVDPDYFKLVQIDNGGGIEWPNGFDFCPNFLRENMDEVLVSINNVQ